MWPWFVFVCFILFHVLLFRFQLDTNWSHGKKECQLRLTVGKSWRVFSGLMMMWEDPAHWGGANSGQVVLGGRRTVFEHEPGEQASSSMASASVPAWLASVMNSDESASYFLLWCLPQQWKASRGRRLCSCVLTPPSSCLSLSS